MKRHFRTIFFYYERFSLLLQSILANFAASKQLSPKAIANMLKYHSISHHAINHNYLLMLFLPVLLTLSTASSRGQQRHHVFVLTDISTLKADHGEPDDTQSLIRLLLFSDKLQIEGIAATYTNYGQHLYADYPAQVIEAYAVSYKHLRRHGKFASPRSLRRKLSYGNNQCGMKQVGKGHDTPLPEHSSRPYRKAKPTSGCLFGVHQPTWHKPCGPSQSNGRRQNRRKH